MYARYEGNLMVIASNSSCSEDRISGEYRSSTELDSCMIIVGSLSGQLLVH
jgi:hypothetical protein